MKKKLPYIVNFEDLYDIYKMIDTHDIQNFHSLIDRSDKPDKFVKGSVKGEGEEKREIVLDLLTKHKDTLDEIEYAMLDFVQFQVMSNPKVIVSRTKDVKTEKIYFTAKTHFPLKGGKRKEVRIYLGKAEEFNNDTLNKRAHNLAKLKMQQTLARRLREGSL